MNINTIENIVISWENIPGEKLHGSTGLVNAQTTGFSTFKIRQLHFSENYEADHWCEKGHIIHVLNGELIIEYKDGSSTTISKGNTLVLGDNISLHKARTQTAAHILIID